MPLIFAGCILRSNAPTSLPFGTSPFTLTPPWRDQVKENLPHLLVTGATGYIGGTLTPRLRLRAQMKMPGDAWLQFEALQIDAERSRLVQSVFFASKGLFGLAYWFFLYPIHRIIFSHMFQRLVHGAEAASRST